METTLFNNFRAIVAIASERVPDDRKITLLKK